MIPVLDAVDCHSSRQRRKMILFALRNSNVLTESSDLGIGNCRRHSLSKSPGQRGPRANAKVGDANFTLVRRAANQTLRGDLAYEKPFLTVFVIVCNSGNFENVAWNLA